MFKRVLGLITSAVVTMTLCAGKSNAQNINVTGCDFLAAYNILSCYSIKNDSVTALIDALDAASNWTEIHLVLNNYVIDQLPSDIFTDVELTYLSINFNCSSNGIPKTQLQSINSPLSYLEFVLLDKITAILQSDFTNVPFAHDLDKLNLQLTELSSIEDGSFAQFDQLTSLTIAKSSLTELSAGLLQGLSNLQELFIVQSSISTLPQGLFSSTPQMKNLWLGENNLQTLVNGTMDGLNQIQLVSVAGNPFVCDCALQWFKDWLIEKSLLETSGATCEYPVNAPFQDVDFCPVI